VGLLAILALLTKVAVLAVLVLSSALVCSSGTILTFLVCFLVEFPSFLFLFISQFFRSPTIFSPFLFLTRPFIPGAWLSEF